MSVNANLTQNNLCQAFFVSSSVPSGSAISPTLRPLILYAQPFSVFPVSACTVPDPLWLHTTLYIFNPLRPVTRLQIRTSVVPPTTAPCNITAHLSLLLNVCQLLIIKQVTSDCSNCTEGENPSCWATDVSQCVCVHHKSHIHLLGTSPRPSTNRFRHEQSA